MFSPKMRWCLAGAAAVSGAGALLFEVLWGRGLALVLGSTAEANAAVFAAFLTAMTIGASSAGAFIERVRHPVRLYIAMELLAGLGAAIMAVLVTAEAPAIADLLGDRGGLFVAYALALAIMGGPVMLVGATFPVLMAILGRLGGTASRMAGPLYAANVVGGAIGAVVSVFLIVHAWGIPGAAVAGFLLHAAGGVGVFAVARRVAQNTDGPATDTDEYLTASTVPGVSLVVAAAIGFVGGAAALGFEVVWTRLGSYIAGSRLQAMALVLGATLVALGIGAWLSKPLRERYGRTALMIAAGAVPLGIVLSVDLGWLVAQHRDAIEAYLPGFPAFAVGWRFVEVFIPIAIALVPLGLLYPLALSLASGMDSRSGHVTGWITAANTAGAAIGALLVGFVGLQTIGLFGTTRAIVVVVAVIVLGVGCRVFRHAPRQAVVYALPIILAIAATSLLPVKPILDRADQRRVLAFEEDRAGVTTIAERVDGALRVTLNRTQLVWYFGRRSTTRAQQDQAHLPMAYAPDADRALVLGAGYGITAGTMARYGLDRVDVVEPYEALYEHADLFAAGNFGYVERDNVDLHVGDGRRFVSAVDEPDYDVVSINMTDPTLPGNAALMRSDFYTALKDRLAPGAVVLQQAFREPHVVLATLRDAFNHVRIYQSYRGCECYNAIASDKPLTFDREAWLERARSPLMDAVGERYGVRDWTHLAEKIERGWTSPARHPRYFEGPVATDLFPRLLFGWDPGAAMLEES